MEVLQTHRSICVSIATSAAHLKTARVSFSTSGQGPGAAQQRYYELGFVAQNEVRTPLAAYNYIRDLCDSGFVLIQHGSHQWVCSDDQPGIDNGEVLLYRGVGDARTYRQLMFQADELSAENREVWRKYLAVQAHMLSDSLLSFNTIHDRTKRCETAGLRDGTWLADTLAAHAGLEIGGPGFARDLWQSAQQIVFPRSGTNSARTMSS
jgi:hypothetical protein